MTEETADWEDLLQDDEVRDSFGEGWEHDIVELAEKFGEEERRATCQSRSDKEKVKLDLTKLCAKSNVHHNGFCI
jgi:putative sterol carrier protein